jgi:hypothetical protein
MSDSGPHVSVWSGSSDGTTPDVPARVCDDRPVLTDEATGLITGSAMP